MANMEASCTSCAWTYRIWWPNHSKGGSKLKIDMLLFSLLPFVNKLELFSSFSGSVVSSLFTARTGIKQNCKISLMQQKHRFLQQIWSIRIWYPYFFGLRHLKTVIMQNMVAKKKCPQHLPVFPFAIAFPPCLSSLCSVFILLWCTMRIKSHMPNFITIFFQNVKILETSVLWMTRDGL